MSDRYDHLTIEPKWQKKWAEAKLYQVTEDAAFPKEKRFYCLDMFPYPSGAGLHVGHPEGYTASDILCRYKRMNGFNILHPMGWDAFGLPAENYAIKTGTHPAVSTAKNITNFRRQIQAFGFCYDWSREIDTTDPEYFKWTQWIFLQLYKKGLAYEANMPINWCESCQTGIANEEVKDGCCERCGGTVVKKDLRQWMLKITAYAERLLNDLDLLDWPEPIKLMQRNWIGKSLGAEVDFELVAGSDTSTPLSVLKIFTTRPDTLYGATFMVVAPEHTLLEEITTPEQKQKVQEYVRLSRLKSDLERAHLDKDKTGVFTGGYAVNPVNGAKIPIWVADYVLISYGTGAIMAVPAHDERDLAFAQKYNIPVITIFGEDGKASNSEKYNGLTSAEFKEKITADLEKKGVGQKTVNYKLRDWVFARQRYWGEPIPLVHCPQCGVVAVPENELPLKLPAVDRYEPTGTGESPLANIPDWVNTKCPQCGGAAKRETNTMPQWAGSSWYYLRYIDPRNQTELADKNKLAYWLPVDHYIGGAEHAVLHLLYARFWHKVLFDLGVVSTPEPFQCLTNQGLILAEDGQKMSKSRGNVINPDEVIRDYGADAMRLYEMFMGPLEMAKPWSTKGILGVRRFLDRVWNIFEQKKISDELADEELLKILQQTIKKVGEDINNLSFNTGIAQLMIFINAAQSRETLSKKTAEDFLKLLAPYAPHLAEELWEKLGHKTSIHLERWPEYDAKYLTTAEVEIVFSVNGKARGAQKAAKGLSQAELEKLALANPAVQKYLAGKTIIKKIIVPDKIVNFVVG
ncbi:leucyl-tRNA synthetase [Candidatus Termititenax aidoneus]|uniref:Leucine--tRNA ligase n=1 Tax=Termititenax aidoneus TaxID=2218524 RepID=A0A388TC68_TERA1|nr:leucyl-tRNA synthetase [Candidatus Termititenax aidoneus]